VKIKKLVVSLVLGILGFLLALSGLNLIQLSAKLALYAGLALFALAALNYFLL